MLGKSFSLVKNLSRFDPAKGKKCPFITSRLTAKAYKLTDDRQGSPYPFS